MSQGDPYVEVVLDTTSKYKKLKKERGDNFLGANFGGGFFPKDIFPDT